MSGSASRQTSKAHLLADVAGAGDLARDRAVRVAALGKKGAISELMAHSARCRPTSAKPSAPPSTR